jgi:SH3 domain-containing YSC84-like protein 1
LPPIDFVEQIKANSLADTSSRRKMKKLLSTLTAVALVCLPLAANAADSKETERLTNCGTVMEEVLNVPENIPQKLLDKAECVIVIPSVLKAAFLVGGAYGRGAMTCRSGVHFTGKWSAPTMIALEGGSFGFQLGAEATDFVILVMNPRGASAILSSKVKLGADASAAAGPKGRDAEADTNVTLRAEMLTYSRSRGLFAGISLEGSTLRPDDNANTDVYGKHISATAIVLKNAVPVPAAGQKLISVLDKRSRRNDSDPKSLK